MNRRNFLKSIVVALTAPAAVLKIGMPEVVVAPVPYDVLLNKIFETYYLPGIEAMLNQKTLLSTIIRGQR
jgi:hypothetical protein